VAGFARGIDAEEEELPVLRVLDGIVRDAEKLRHASGRGRLATFRLSELRARLATARVFADPSRLLARLKRRGLVADRPEGRSDRVFQIPYPEELARWIETEIDRGESAPLAALQPIPDEGLEIRRMDAEFLTALHGVLGERLEATLEFGRRFSIDTLTQYLKGLFGELLYPDSLIALLQQYALADVPLLAPTGRATGLSGFHLALFGPPGTGKTFSIDDMVRGNPRSGVPAHGLPGRNRYCGGITPVQFLRVGAAYAGRTFNFIVPEFNDWFKYRGMVEPLKLVMEQREVKWETTLGVVGPYTFRSFLSVNYNVRTVGPNDFLTTFNDPNFSALEDRMLLRYHPMTRERFRAVEASAERLDLGEIDFPLAGPLRDHLTLVHAIETRHPLVAHRFPVRAVQLDRRLYGSLREVSEKVLARTPNPTFSPRLKARAVRLASAAALLGYFRDGGEGPIPIGKAEGDFARQFYESEIRVRESRRGALRPAG
jgi:hypothetical protein